MNYKEFDIEQLYLSYERILERFKIKSITTASGKIITLKDLIQATNIMEKKHKNCRWKFMIKRKNYILIEGYYWLLYVYFQKEKKQIDADINFFIKRIQQYEKLLNINPEILWNKDIEVKNLTEYFNRKPRTIKNKILEMNKILNIESIKEKDNRNIISKNELEWLCKNCFKQKYLELLEKYKMKLTEEYIKMGYLYDNF